VRKPKSNTISGFEFLPHGALLTQIVVDDSDFGYAHERSIGYRKDWHAHDRLNIALPRGSSIIRFKNDEGREVRIDQNHFMVMKKNVRHMQWSETHVWDNFALLPAPALFQVPDEIGILDDLPDLVIARRSPLLNDVIEKLFFDAIVCRLQERDIKTTYQFALKLILETVKSLKEEGRAAPADQDHDLFEKTLTQIENRLFEKLSAEAIAESLGTSRASVYRAFQNLTGQSLMSYVRRRRLEEARHLLANERNSVGDVALLVGYSDLYAFSNAYKKVFGVAPSKDQASKKRNSQSS
jgi:AraC-like DNA-binding protein